MLGQAPGPDRPADRLSRLVADRRTEVDEQLTPPILRPPWAKRVAQKVKGGDRIGLTSIPVFAVDDLRLLRVELKSAVDETLLQRCLQMFSLPARSAVADRIIGIPLEWDGRLVPLHPRIEGVVQKQVSQQRTDNTALRRPSRPCLQASIRQLHRGFQPPFDMEQHPFILSVVTHPTPTWGFLSDR